MVHTQFSFQLQKLLIVTLVKGSFVCLVVYCITRMVKRMPSELKHLLWLCAILSFMLIPFFSSIIPGMPVATLTITEEHSEAYKTVASLISAQENGAEASGRIAAYAPLSVLDHSQDLHFPIRWRFWVLMAWLAGVGVSTFRFVRGKIGLFHLTKNGKLIQDSRSALMLKSISEDMGIRRGIVIVGNPMCKIPFTYNLFKPKIVFPIDSENWPVSKIHAVLLHELAHIKRRDNLTQFIARVICVLFWYMPFLWIAYSSLYLAQEETCDAFVIDGGTRPTEYARFMVHFARYSESNAFLTGISISKGRVKLLEKRVLHVLYPKGGNKMLRGGKKMMTRILMISMVLLLSVAVLPASYAKDREFYVPTQDEEIYGTWINTEYSGDLTYEQKYVQYSWGYFESYSKVGSKTPVNVNTGTSTLVDKWTDTGGNIWYKEYVRCQVYGGLYQIVKISDNGDTLEYMWANVDFPFEADLTPESATYRIYYRE
jgi:beta-lactamase regulating signal transducer with metallopeptidase domain